MKFKRAVTIDIEAWAAKAASLYPEITSVHLVGSRAIGGAMPESDYDVVICVSKNCYDSESRQIGRTEQRIAFDPALHVEANAVEVFFLRPGGGLGRWAWGPDELPLDVMEAEEGYLKDCFLRGLPEGDFSRFYNDLKYAQRLFEREESAAWALIIP